MRASVEIESNANELKSKIRSDWNAIATRAKQVKTIVN